MICSISLVNGDINQRLPLVWDIGYHNGFIINLLSVSNEIVVHCKMIMIFTGWWTPKPSGYYVTLYIHQSIVHIEGLG